MFNFVKKSFEVTIPRTSDYAILFLETLAAVCGKIESIERTNTSFFICIEIPEVKLSKLKKSVLPFKSRKISL